MVDSVIGKKEAAKKKLANKDSELLTAYRTVFSGPLGEKVLFDIMQTGFFLSPMLVDSPLICQSRMGMRELVVKILNKVHMNETYYMATYKKKIKEEEDYLKGLVDDED